MTATKKKKSASLFTQLATGLTEATAISRGEADEKTFRTHVPEKVDVRAIRTKTGLSQTEFSSTFGFTPGRVRDWEQGRTDPDGAMRAYLRVIEEKPQVVLSVLQAVA